MITITTVNKQTKQDGKGGNVNVEIQKWGYLLCFSCTPDYFVDFPSDCRSISGMALCAARLWHLHRRPRGPSEKLLSVDRFSAKWGQLGQ